MAVLNLESNGLYGDNGAGILSIATDYDGVTFADGTGTNEDETITALEEYTWADLGYFENFQVTYKNGDEKIITTDYCDVGEISRKSEQIAGFTVDIQEILDMENLALILGAELNTRAGHETIGIKRKQRTKPYQLFKFVTCPKGGKSNTFYFVKSVMTGDLNIPVINLNRSDFTGVTMEFEVAEGGNFILDKAVA